MWKGWRYTYVCMSCIPVCSHIFSHTHTQISRRQYLTSRHRFYTRPTLPHTLTLQRLCHAMAHTHHIWRCQGSVYVTWTQLRTDTKMMATNRITWHTHHIWRCQGTVYVTCTVLNHQQSKWRPCLPSVYGPYIMSHEHSYAQTQKMMATNRIAWHIDVHPIIESCNVSTSQYPNSAISRTHNNKWMCDNKTPMYCYI